VVRDGQMPACAAGAQAKATNCNPSTRTVNTNATCGADDDWYYFSPWRAVGLFSPEPNAGTPSVTVNLACRAPHRFHGTEEALPPFSFA